MTHAIEKTSQRKENIESIEPLISAMRTISLSNWRSSLNRKINQKPFLSEMESIYAILNEQGLPKLQSSTKKKKIIYVLGSNRGLCGNFNKRILKFFNQQNIGNQNGQKIILVGTKLFKLFSESNITIQHSIDFPEIQKVQDFSISICSPLANELDQTIISVVYNKYSGASKYYPVMKEIYPIEKQQTIFSNDKNTNFIIDTNKQHLFSTVEFFLLITYLQNCLYSSSAAENSARFVNMENAGRNVDNLIDELKIIIQNHRRRLITEETQELAVSSGLLN